MNQTTSTMAVARAIRVLHLALVAGLVLAAGVFVVLIQVIRFPAYASPTVGVILAAVSIMLLVLAAAFLRRRIPERRGDEQPDSYWESPELRGAAIVLWAVTEGAALLGLIGYLLTGAPVPAVAAGIAIATLILFRPSHLEGAA